MGQNRKPGSGVTNSKAKANPRTSFLERTFQEVAFLEVADSLPAAEAIPLCNIA